MTDNLLIDSLFRLVSEGKPSSGTVLTAIDQLKLPNHSSDPNTPLDYWIRRTVTNPALPQDDEEAIRRILPALPGETELDPIRGALGFTLFCRCADRTQTSRVLSRSSMRHRAPDQDLNEANDLLEQREVRAFIRSFYDVAGLGMGAASSNASVRLLAAGTTSYILRVPALAGGALKIIKPYFAENNTIRTQTRSYRELVQRAVADRPQFFPTIHETGDLYILMEFIEGSSLAALMLDDAFFKLSIGERLNIAYGIIDSLSYLRIPHLDISPSNTMLTMIPAGATQESRFYVRLIDFGHNYLLQENIAGIPIRSDVIKYAAPELSESVHLGDTKSDLYSLGMIILDLLRPDKQERDLSVALDECWRQHPHLAGIVTDLVASNPRDRATWSEGLEPGAVYRELRSRVEEEQELAKITERNVEMTSVWNNVTGPISEAMRMFAQFPRIREARKRNSISAAKAVYLSAWSAATNIYLSAALAACGYMFFVHTLQLQTLLPQQFNLDALAASFEITRDRFTEIWTTPSLETDFAARIMAVTIVLVVGQYYNRIFSTATSGYARVVNGAVVAEVTMRATPFVIGALCVVTAIWIPQHWYITSFVGPLMTAWNNAAVLRFAKNVKAEAKQRQQSEVLATSEIRQFFEMFQRWPASMVIMGAGIFIIGLLIRLGVLQDEAFLGTGIAFVSFVVLFQGQSTYAADMMREGIRRTVYVAEGMKASGPRNLLLKQRHPAPSPNRSTVS